MASPLPLLSSEASLLEGPLLLQAFPSLSWRYIAVSGLRLAVIVGIAILILGVVNRLVNQWLARVESLESSDPRRQRAVTLGGLIQSTAKYIVWPLAAIMALSELGLDVGALIATAGVAGLAIGFGSQTLVKDVIGGVFLLFDDVLRVGDLVNIGGHVGTVEDIGVRLVKMRKFDGEQVIIPAGDIRTFGNKSVDWARAIVPVGLSYDQDVDAILPTMERVAQAWADENADILLEDAPQVQGLMDFGDSSVTARIVVQVKPGTQYAAERELRKRLKRVFDEQNVEIPFPQRTVHVIDEGTRRSTRPDPLSDPSMVAGTSDGEGAD